MPRRTTSRLTDAFVRSLKPREKRYDVYDAQLAGFGIRVSPLGTKSWIVLSRNNQRKTRVTLSRYPQTPLNTARQHALVILNEMAQGKYKRTNSFECFSDALQEWYLRDQSTNKSFAQVEKTIALHVEPHLNNFKIREIEKRDLLKIIDRVGKKLPHRPIAFFLLLRGSLLGAFRETYLTCHLPMALQSLKLSKEEIGFYLPKS